jgi:hypothetical protein
VHTLSATGAGVRVTAEVRMSTCLPFTGGAASSGAGTDEWPRWIAWTAVGGGLVLVVGALAFGFRRRLAQVLGRR